MRKWMSVLLLFVVLFTSCSPASAPQPAVTVTPTVTLRPPQVLVTSVPDVQATAQAFLQAWQAEDYATMYAMLTRVSQDAINAENFAKRYQETAVNMTLQKLDFEVLSALTNPTAAQVSYRVDFHTAMAGDIQREMVMNLALNSGAWQVQWEDGMIMPELRNGNRLEMEIKPPARGNIYDRNGKVIAAQTDAVALGLAVEQIDRPASVVNQLSDLTGRTPESIRALFEDAPPGYVPVGEVPKQAVEKRMDVLLGLGGLVLREYNTRLYFEGGVAPHAVGYVLSISAEELEQYRRKGYRQDEKIGAAGLEKFADQQLMGGRGADLYVIDQSGNVVTRLAQVASRPAQSVYTTLDRDFQIQVQQAVAGFRGAVVVLERDTGRVLAIASSPTFDPNLFDPQNINTRWALGDMLNDGEQRLLNRASQGGGYPLGSVFKIITMAAALESGLYVPETTYDCGHYFTELPGPPLEDWTVAKGYPPSGELDLRGALMRSCNPWFYHIGLDLFRRKGATLVSGLARGFGLGAPVGTGQIAEATGAMPDPESDDDAVQMAIGQGTMLVTPLQVASFVAALGNGGTLYRPQIIEKVGVPDGAPSSTFTPEAFGKLPIKPETLTVVREAMRMVVAEKRGTAFKIFTGLNVPVYGKTGTAQNSAGNAHAWFAGYTDAKDPERPDIAVAIIAENAGEGSEIAAPIFRRVIEVYFDGRPGRLYPWEAKINVTRTPTPLATDTPVPVPTDIIVSTPGPEEEVTATPIQ